MNTTYHEYNFDGIVGPTHNYSGLSVGNVASIINYDSESNPKDAALQGLAKMKKLHDLGLKQAVLPPQVRPDFHFLKSLGFTGSEENILQSAFKHAPRLLAASYSASSMWTANAATVTPSLDSSDGKLHLTPANLAYNIHRSLEAQATYNNLSAIFSNQDYFTVHNFLKPSRELGDEGAANHTRFCSNYNSAGLNLFVYGKEVYCLSKNIVKPSKYPARQSIEASKAVARLHGLNNNNSLFLQQTPKAIDKGVFHNDVIAVGNQNILLCHEHAFVDQKNNLMKLLDLASQQNIDLNIFEISEKDLSLDDMVQSYIFNSQLVNLDQDNMAFIAPMECQHNQAAKNVINHLIDDHHNNINHVYFIDCKQSMRNGGGPACLRLRVLLSEQEADILSGNIIFTDKLYNSLVNWVNKHYRDRLTARDFVDPKLAQECMQAMDDLARILDLRSINQYL